MEESTLLKIATLSALIGIMILAFISNNTNLEYNDISSIDDSKIDKKVKVKGTLTNFISTEKAKILEIQDETGSIKAVIFQEEELNIKINDLIELSGKVTIYQNSLEIIVDSITKFE